MAIDLSRLTSAGATAPASANSAEKKKEEKNVGGLLGGIGYLGEKAAVGFVQSVEGIADYTSAGLAKLFGADDFAEKQMKEDWFGEWYSHPDEWYKPGKGWQFAGDIASGIGSSVPSLAVGIGATVLTAASGGTAAPATVPMLAGAFGGGITAGLSAAGGATKEAYSETGELGGKEFGYGLLSGVVEGGTEALTNALSLGTGAIIKNVGKSIAKEAVETVSRQTVVKGLIGSFAGEAFEEGFATWISPTLKRATYDKNAKSASFGEITYSAITGGIAGMVMDGGNIAINAAVNIKNGASAVNRGFAPEILGLSQRIASFENANKTGNEAYEAVAQTYKKLSDSIAETGGEVRTTEQMRMLGELQRGNTAAVFTPMVTRSAAEIYANAEAIAQRLTEYGYTDKPVTAEDIRKGVNPEDARSFSAALKENTLLRELAVADVTGHLIMNTRKFRDATLAGKNYASQADLNRFAETATPEEIRAVSEALGIESWETLTAEQFEQKVVDYMTRGGENVSRVDAALSDNVGTLSGTGVITDNVGVITDNVGKSNNDIGTVTRRNAQTAEEFARANVRGYNELSATNQGMIRKVIRAAIASGMSQSDAKMYAEVSAHSGIDIVFDKEACRVGDTYADGYYDEDRNRIVVNPEGTRSAEKLLLQELDHAIRLAYGKDGRAALVEEAYLGISPEEAQKITAKYRKIGADTATILDEANAYFAETALSDAGVLERLWQKEKTLGEKIVEFFTGAKEAYKGEKKLEGAAKRYEKLYREMFRSFAEKNRGRNAEDLTRINSEKAHVSGKRYALPEDNRFTIKDADELIREVNGTPELETSYTAQRRDRATHTKSSAFRVFEGVKDSDLLSAASRDEIVSRIYEAMNSTESMNERKYVSRQIAEIYVRRLLSETPADTGAYREAKNTLAWAGQGIRKIRFTKSDAAEIKKIVGEDEYKRLRRRWGSKTRIGLDEIRKIVGKDESERIRKAGKGRQEFTPGQLISLIGEDEYRTIQNELDRKYGRYTVASYAKMIADTVPQAQRLRGVSPYAALVDIDKTYGTALSATREAVPAAYETDAAYAEALIRNAEDAILQGFADQDKAVMQRKLDETAELAERSKAELTEMNKTLRYRGYIASSVQTLRDMKKGTFDSASEHKGDTFDKIVSALAGIEWRKNLSVDMAREAFGKLERWYTKDNPIFAELAEDDPDAWNKDIADMVHSLAVGEGAFTVEQFANIDNVLRYFVNYIKNYNKVFYNGKLVEATGLAEEFVGLATEAKKYAGGAFFRSVGRSYLETFADPATVVRRMDGYRNGFYTQMLGQLRAGAIKADVNYYNLTKRYEEFMDNNKSYLREAEKATVKFEGRDIPKMQAIGLYMTMKREHAHLGLLFNGFAYLDGDGEKVRVNGFAEAELSPEDAIGVIAAKRRKLEEAFTPEDIEYISILEKVYNEDARALKASRDMQRYGFTNAMDDYYYPIRRANTRQKVDTGDSGELDRVSSASFNKDIVTGAAGELLIENADTLFRRHARAVSQYEALSPAIEAYNKIFNLDVSGNKNKPVSVRTVYEERGENGEPALWVRGTKYMRDLVEDVQGIKRDRGEGMEFLGKIRSGYAKFQLGANPKTLASQISSIFASSSVLDYDAILGSTNISGKGVDSYCTLAMLRNAENTAAMAQGNLTPAQRVSRRIDTVSDALMKPIGMVDRFVVTRLFAACQKQIELRGGEKVGTVQNKIEAGKLLEKVIIETQQNSFATERSAAMRSGNEFYRTVTMFTSDAMKTVGRAIDAFGEVSVLRKRSKAGENVDDALAAAKKQMLKSTLAMASVAAYSAAIAQFFRWLYNKDRDEDETVVGMMITDFGASMLGGLPIIKEVYAQFTDGYGLEDYTLASFNDLLAAVESVTTFVPDIITGKAGADDIPGKVRSLAYAVGQFTGLPVRNVYNMLYGITKRVAPNAAYRVDDFFMDKNYTSDLRRAVESGDEKRAYMLMGIITGQRIGDMSEEAAAELHRLAMAGHSVMPREVSETFTVDGEEYKMTADEMAAVSEIYGASATEGIAKLIASRGFTSLPDTAKADAVKYLYQVSHDMAISDTYGIDRGNAALVATAIGADAVALAYAATKGITSDTDRKGKTVEGSKRKKVSAAIQALPISTEAKLLLICAKGYAIKDGDVRGMSAQAAKARLKRYVSRLPNREKLLKIIK